MLASLWRSARAVVARLLGREPAPGRFESGSKFSSHGFIRTAPLSWPSRDYLIYVPRGYGGWRRVPLLVLCHGCKQTPEDFARGTRIAEFADRMGCVVLLPRQKDTANPWRCWNWFDARTSAGNGEAAILAAQIRSVRRQYRIDRKRIVIAGISAGGALAAVMGLRYPRMVAGVAVHSGLACGAATTTMSAVNAMRQGPNADTDRIADDARLDAGPAMLRMPLLVVHGSTDRIVAPRNAVALVRQYLRFNAHPAAMDGATSANVLPLADAEKQDLMPDGRVATTREWRDGARVLVRYVEVTGLGHAWSGGDAQLEFNDAGMPDATALVGAFFADALS
jgi:poly(hydroxyalkanoate) depolymerase family esterase